MDTTLTNQTIKLRDGRTLGFAEWGDFNGLPVFLFAGSSNARFARYPDDTVLVELGVHLYTFDRPGMGLSDRQPGRRLLDWAQDIRDFATQKQLTRFATIAASQGGPYGTACAYALPDLLSSVSLVSGVSPLDDPQIMATQNRMIRSQIFLARHFPGVMTLQMNLMRLMLNGDRPRKMFQAVFKNLPEGDQQVMNHTSMLDVLVQDLREGMRQGGRGGVDDMRAVVMDDWGFKLEEIRTRVFLWQGEADPNVTPAMGRYLAARIPNCEATFVPGAGHFLMYTHWRQILTQLIKSFAPVQNA